MKWPFSLAWPGGLVNNQVPTHSDLNKLDAQVAQAADGAVWSDVCLAKNLCIKSDNLQFSGGPTFPDVAIWEPSLQRWWCFSGHATVPAVSWSVDGRRWRLGGLPFGGGLSFTSAQSAAVNGAGKLIVGGSTSTAIATKYRESPDGGASWNIRSSTSSTSGHGPRAIAWVPFLSLFISGHTNGVLETSPDGITWTARSMPAGITQINSIADNGSVVVASGYKTGPTPVVYTSIDGITWTERTCSVANHVVYNSYWQKFFIVDGSHPPLIASSIDGTIWSTTAAGPPFVTNVRRLLSFGRMLIATGEDAIGAGVAVSIDGGVSWTLTNYFDEDTSGATAIGPGGALLACSYASSVAHSYASPRGAT